RGILTIDRAEIIDAVARAANAGIAVAIHAIGDRAVHLALDAIEPTRASAPQLRQKVEHVQLVREDDLGRFAKLGVIASMQPIHATSDRDLADRYWGPQRIKRAYPWRTFLASGVVLAFGSDAPVEPIDPLLGIHAAVARRRPNDAAAWTPEQRLTVDEALAGYASGAAYALGREHEAGTLMLGDHGADVVKVEIPGEGDETRSWMPPAMGGVSAYYLAINRNKRSVTLDLKHPDGKRVLERMIERSDVVVENFSPGVLARL